MIIFIEKTSLNLLKFHGFSYGNFTGIWEYQCCLWHLEEGLAECD